MKVLSVAILITCLSTAAFAVELPNPATTPGEANPVLTKEVICASDFRTRGYRNVPQSLKNEVYKLYGVRNHEGYCSGPQGCEVDHLIALEDGGQNSVKNLWPQPFDGQWNAHQKDKLETVLHNMICSNQISLEQAQKEISTDWIAAFKKYVK